MDFNAIKSIIVPQVRISQSDFSICAQYKVILPVLDKEISVWVGIHKRDQAQVEPKISSSLQLFTLS